MEKVKFEQMSSKKNWERTIIIKSVKPAAKMRRRMNEKTVSERKKKQLRLFIIMHLTTLS